MLTSRTALKLLAVIVCAALLTACPQIRGPGAERRDKAFVQAVETYRKLIRWGYFEQASEYLKGKDAPLPAPKLAAYAGYKVTGYDVGEEVLSNDGDEARVVALIEFYEVASHITGTVRDEQYWWYDNEAKRWYLGTPLPVMSVGPQVREISR
jgi:hypothetical protein